MSPASVKYMFVYLFAGLECYSGHNNSASLSIVWWTFSNTSGLKMHTTALRSSTPWPLWAHL